MESSQIDLTGYCLNVTHIHFYIFLASKLAYISRDLNFESRFYTEIHEIHNKESSSPCHAGVIQQVLKCQKCFASTTHFMQSGFLNVQFVFKVVLLIRSLLYRHFSFALRISILIEISS